MESSNLVVFTKNFGNNFSGATVATYNLILFFKTHFKNIIIVCKNTGVHSIGNNDNITIINYKNVFEARSILKKMPHNYTFYSDDHFGYILKTCGKPYIHVYHGSWPDAMFLNFKMFILSFYYIPQYVFSIRNASLVVNVSFYMEKFCRNINPATCVIRNGLGQSSNKKKDTFNNNSFKILMVGTIDNLKYKAALKLFQLLQEKGLTRKITVDIYGNIKNRKLKENLTRYNFINVKGFSSKIDYSNYDLYLSTSYFENLSIALCEALNAHVPVFAFNVGGLNEVVEQYVNGFLAPKGNVHLLAANLKLLLNGELRLDASKTDLSQYNWETASSKYIRFFKMKDISI